MILKDCSSKSVDGAVSCLYLLSLREHLLPLICELILSMMKFDIYVEIFLSVVSVMINVYSYD